MIPDPKVTYRQWTLALPWTKPPLSLNQRLHYRAKARLERDVRYTARVLARHHKIPALGRCEVLLEYRPPDRRRRDADNLVATLKPLCDGLVDAGVVLDDTPDLMSKPIPVIGPIARPGRLLLHIAERAAFTLPGGIPVVVRDDIPSDAVLLTNTEDLWR